MLSASREDRKTYIRESANSLASISSIALSGDTAHTLIERFRTITQASEKIGAELYLTLLAGCRDLCLAAEQNKFSEREAAQASEILKEAVVNIQTSLFSVALFGDVEKDRPRLNDSTTRIQQFLRNGSFILPEGEESKSFAPASPPVPLPVMSRMEILETLSAPLAVDTGEAASAPPFSVDEPVSSQLGPPPEVRIANKLRILATVEKLLQKSGTVGDVAADAVELACIARETYGIPFAQICARVSAESGFTIQCDTPEYPVESQLVRSILDQLREWLRNQQLARTIIAASARQTGRILWIELRLKECFVMTPDLVSGAAGQSETAKLARVSGNVEHCYVNTDGHLVQRTFFNLTLSLFEAYRIQSGADAFLIAATSIRAAGSPEGAAPLRVSARLFPSPLGAPRAGDPSPKQLLSIGWREKSAQLEVDSISGPAQYVSRKALLPGPVGREIVGMAWEGATGASKPLWILDTDLWLDTIAREQARARPSAPAPAGEKWRIFTVAGLRYAVPAETVVTVGEVGAAKSFIETEQGVCRLRDFRELANLPAARGAAPFFLLIRGREGLQALAVDQVEDSQTLRSEPAVPGGGSPWKLGTAICAGVEIQLVDAEQLFGPGVRLAA